MSFRLAAKPDGNQMTKQIPLTQGKFALVDDDMFEYLSQWKWYYDKKSGYAFRNGKKYSEKHTVLMHQVIAETPLSMETDHKDLNRLNNTKENLRICTKSQNMSNGSKRSDNTSGYKGVSWSKVSKKFHVYINKNGKRINLGFYDDVVEAAMVYDEKAREIFGEFARTNL